MELPQRHKGTKVHQDFILYDFFLVQLCALVPWWQKENYLRKFNISTFDLHNFGEGGISTFQPLIYKKWQQL